MSVAVEEKCELVGFLSPHAIDVKDGKIRSVTFKRTEVNENDEWVEDVEQLTTIKTNFLISAFGSGLYEEDGKVSTLCVHIQVTYYLSYSSSSFGTSTNQR